MDKLKKWGTVILVIGGIVLFYWLLNAYDKNREDKIEKQVSRVCEVILLQQPENLSLYDSCWDRGIEEFSPTPN